MIITYDEDNGVVSLRKTSIKEEPYDSIHIEDLVEIWQKSKADTPQTEQMKTADYCDICKRDMCEVCIADATNPYCVPSHYEIRYEPKDEPKTQMKTQNLNLTLTEGVWNAGYKTGYDKGYKDAQKVKDRQDLVKDLVKAFGEDGTWLERKGVYTLTLAEAKQRAVDIIESVTQTETQNSNLTFEKRTMRDCYNCKRYETEDECIECHYEPKDEPQKKEVEWVYNKRERLWYPYSNGELLFKDEPQTDCAWK